MFAIPGSQLRILMALLIYFGLFPRQAAADEPTPPLSTKLAQQNQDLVLALGPFFGGGFTDSKATMRHNTGYTISLERNWPLGLAGLHLGPRLEFSNNFINTKQQTGDVKSISIYDNRLIGAGIIVRQSTTSAESWLSRLYASLIVGKAYSKILIDESGTRFFRQSEFERLNGTWLQSEIGGAFPLRGSLALNIGIIANRLLIDQSAAIGRYEGDSIAADGSMSLISGNLDNSQQQILANRARFDSLALRLGLAIGF